MSLQVLASAAASPAALYVAAVSTLCGLVSTSCAVYVVVRDGRRLKTGEAKLLGERIQRAQESADRWYETEKGRDLWKVVEVSSGRIASCEDQLRNVATKTDVARIEGSVSRVESSVASVEQGVDRIEGLLLRKALDVR